VEYKADGPNDFVADNAGDMAKYGLEDGGKDQIRIEVKRTVGGRFGSDKSKTTTDVLIVGKETDDKDDKKRYARLESEKNVVKIAAKGLEAIQNVLDNPAVLRNRNLVDIDANLKLPDVVTIKDAGGQTIKLYRPDNGSEWKMFREGSPPQKADIPAVEALVRAIAEKRLVKDFTPSGTSEGAASTVISSGWTASSRRRRKRRRPRPTTGQKGHEVHREERREERGEKGPERRAEAQERQADVPADVRQGRPRQERRLRQPRDGQGQHRCAGADDRARPCQAGAARVRGQDPADLRRRRDEGRAQPRCRHRGVQREKKDEKTTWKIVQPKDLEGRPANTFVVDGIIGDLKNLRADKLIEEKADAAVEKKYGLDAPKLKATLTVEKDGKKEDRVYVFGNDATPVRCTASRVRRRWCTRAEVLAERDAGRVSRHDDLHPGAVEGEGHEAARLARLPATAATRSTWSRKGNRDWAVKSSTTPNYNLDPNKAEDVSTPCCR
jgi:hypothetical protein